MDDSNSNIKSLSALPKYKYHTFDKNSVISPSGFVNTGVICWFNALLQSLLSLTSLSQVMLESEDDFIMKPLGKAYIELIKACSNNTNTPTHNIKVLEAFKEQLGTKKFKFLSSNTQECANEGFVLFIDALNCKRVEYLFECVHVNKITCPSCSCTKEERVKNIQVSYYTTRNISENDFSKYLTCHRSDLFDYECPGYNVVVGSDPPTSSVVPKQHGKVRHTYVTESAVRYGEVIVVNFNRMYHRDRKYPPTLSFKGKNGSTVDYRLVSTIEHGGSISQDYRSSGHYWGRSVRMEDGDLKWYQLNDSQVTPSDSKCGSNESMLFYHMVEN